MGEPAVTASVVIPTHRHAETLPYAVASALRQTLPVAEILLCGDGMDGRTRRVARELEAAHEAVRLMDLPKAPGSGDENRGRAALEAAGEIVLYLADDDLWAPRHLEVMAGLLRDSDLAVGAAVFSDGEGARHLILHDYSRRAYRDLLLDGDNRVILSSLAHRRDSYPGPVGPWETAPEGTASDHHFAAAYLRRGGDRMASAAEVTILNLPKPLRSGIDPAKREAEISAELERLSADGGRSLRESGQRLARELALEWEPRMIAAHRHSERLREAAVARGRELAKQVDRAEALQRRGDRRLPVPGARLLHRLWRRRPRRIG